MEQDSIIMGSHNKKSTLLTVLRSEKETKECIESISGADWRELHEDAEKHGVASLVYDCLKRLGIAMPSEIEKKLRVAYLRTAETNSLYYHYIDIVFSACEELSIEVIPLKGIYLAKNIYGNIALREMIDIDILVRPEDLEQLDAVVVDRGFTPMQELRGPLLEEGHNLRYIHAECGLNLEVHWNLMDPADNVSVDIEDLWDRSVEVGSSKGALRNLSIEDLFLHLAVHNANHTFSFGLRGLYDLKVSIGKFYDLLDWSLLVSIARKWGATRALYVNLMLLDALFFQRAPDGVLERLIPGGIKERYLDASKELVFAFYEPNNPAFANWSEPDHASIGNIMEFVFPSLRTVHLKYPLARNRLQVLLYYPIYYKDRLIKYWDSIWGLVFRAESKTKEKKRYGDVLTVKKWLLSE